MNKRKSQYIKLLLYCHYNALQTYILDDLNCTFSSAFWSTVAVANSIFHFILLVQRTLLKFHCKFHFIPKMFVAWLFHFCSISIPIKSISIFEVSLLALFLRQRFKFFSTINFIRSMHIAHAQRKYLSVSTNEKFSYCLIFNIPSNRVVQFPRFSWNIMINVETTRNRCEGKR